MIVIASDHAGVDLKARIVELIGEAGHDVRDLGPEDTTSVDYPDFRACRCRGLGCRMKPSGEF